MTSACKTCCRCKETKALAGFYRNSTYEDGLQRRCKACTIAVSRAYATAHPERVRTAKAAYYQLHKPQILQYTKQRSAVQAEAIRAYQAAYSVLRKSKKHQYDREYRQVNKPALNAKRRNYAKQRRQTDLKYRLALNLRARFYRAVRSSPLSRAAVTLLGCTVDDLRGYLESRFHPGMCWENYGLRGWHIDHIRPLVSFDLTDPAQLKTACHFTNLQPLWWHDNLRKGGTT